MAMRVHELHPTLVHAPLVLIPAAACLELLAATARSRPRRYMLDALGRGAWWGAAASGLAAGLAGMAASQEVRVEDDRARDSMYVHGIGNLALVVATFGVAAWRVRHPATLVSGVLSASAAGAAVYTAWLGGELVYTHGVGVEGMPANAPVGIGDSPPLRSRKAPMRLVRDAARGLGWLFRTTGRTVRGQQQSFAARAKRGGPGPSGPTAKRPDARFNRIASDVHQPSEE